MWDRVFRSTNNGWSLSLAVGLIAGYLGCSASDSTSTRGGPNASHSFGGSKGQDPPVVLPNPDPPPEQEREAAYRLPVLSGRWIFAANPESGWVAAIDSRDASVALSRAGAQPRYLAALPPADGASARALVLDPGTAQARELRLTQTGLKPSQPLQTHRGANALSVSEDGGWALIWSDARQLEALDPVDSLQDVTLLAFGSASDEPPASTRLSVGYRPKQVIFERGKRRLFVVCERTISIVELGAEPYVDRDVSLPVAAGQAPTDISLTPDGTLALYRVEGQTEVHWLHLEDLTHGVVAFRNPVTDLDLMQDGLRAVVVARGRSIVRQTSADPAGGASNAEVGGASGASGVVALVGGEAGASSGGVGGEPITSGGASGEFPLEVE
ncbi:MAG TPA: hypothetical protein VFQ61_12900, partial [Polyangiaceae bacterium]|nr:hypothetical protein [Polyangiaceae bacterium]